MKKETTVNNSGMGFFGGLTLLLIALKLMGYISWSWWWVLAPIWGPLALLLFLLVVIGVVELSQTSRKGK